MTKTGTKTSRPCTDCRVEKELNTENFYGKLGRYQSRCKACDNRNRVERRRVKRAAERGDDVRAD